MTTTNANPIVGYFHRQDGLSLDERDFYCSLCAPRNRRDQDGDPVLASDLSRDYCEVCSTCGAVFGGEHGTDR